jgi:cytochrome b561
MRSAHSAAGFPRYVGSRAVHWLVAALAVIVVSLGMAVGSTPHHTPARESLLFLHRSVGLTILLLMRFRGLWRWRVPPPLPAALARRAARLASLTHLGRYIAFIVMPLAGYLNAATAGHRVSLFGLFEIPAWLPPNPRAAQLVIAVHLLGQYALYRLVASHVARTQPCADQA